MRVFFSKIVRIVRIFSENVRIFVRIFSKKFWPPCIFGNFKETVNEIKYYIDPGLPVFKPTCRGTSSALLCSRDRQDALPQEPSLLVLLHQPGDETDQGDTEGTLNVVNRFGFFFLE